MIHVKVFGRRSEEFDWLPAVYTWKSVLPFYPREIGVYWLWWSLACRWWFR